MTLNNKWHKRFLNVAYEAASWSKDTSTKVGALIIGADKKPKSFGYNGMPRDVDDDVPERHERPAKYLYFEHAERNAIYNADVPLDGCTIYITHFPCADCARAIIQKRISTVVIDAKNNDRENEGLAERFAAQWAAADVMFAEAGVQVVEVDFDE